MGVFVARVTARSATDIFDLQLNPMGLCYRKHQHLIADHLEQVFLKRENSKPMKATLTDSAMSSEDEGCWQDARAWCPKR